ncbi:hypothetical protein J6590_050066 [Homalodisca vitripennis]|nr:hypothetical protein J6590_050066 [Homalodisca vitripennis]
MESIWKRTFDSCFGKKLYQSSSPRKVPTLLKTLVEIAHCEHCERSRTGRAPQQAARQSKPINNIVGGTKIRHRDGVGGGEPHAKRSSERGAERTSASASAEPRPSQFSVPARPSPRP